MKISILYNSKTGNTKKVAQAMAEALNVEAQSIKSINHISDTDILFLGDGNYAGKYSDAMQQFIDQHLKTSSIKHVVLFGTYGGLTNAMQKLRATLTQLQLPLVPEEFGTKGRAWIFINMFHPNKEALNQAKEFAKNMVSKYQ